MFEGAVAGILNRLLGKYVQDLDTENLNVGIFSGTVNLTDLKLKPEALYELDLPIDVKIGTIGRVSLQIPWSSLSSQPVVVTIEDVLVLVGPAISNSHFDPEREKRLMRAAKRKILQDLEAESEILSGPQNFLEHLLTAVVNNLQVYVRNVHVRYEDSISSRDGPFACGLCLQGLSIETTNSKWKPTPGATTTGPSYQLVKLESLSVYWNPIATVLDDAETADITPIQYYNWKHYMITGLDKFSMHQERFDFILKPVSCKVKVILNRSSEVRVPKLLVDAVVQDSALQLSRRQYLSIRNLERSFRRISLNRKYRHLHPGVPCLQSIKKWWIYAYNAVLEQRIRPFTWTGVKRHRKYYNEYKKAYKNVLRSPYDVELKMDLQKCEDNLPIVSIIIAREHAKFEMISVEPERIEIVETETDWWKPASHEPSDNEDMSPVNIRSKVELCVKTERSKSLWTHLSTPEKQKVCELIGYVEGAPPKEKPKQYIEHKVNLSLSNCSLTFTKKGKEIFTVTLTQFLTSLETRPSAKAYKVSVRAEGLVVEGLMAPTELTPLLVVQKSVSQTTNNFLALDFERNPIHSEADYGICCVIEPVKLSYNEYAIKQLIDFLQVNSMMPEDLEDEVQEMMEKSKGIVRSVASYTMSRRKIFNLNIDVKGVCIVLPEQRCHEKKGMMLITDISRILIKSDLQPSNLVLEDATCMELEERLYDRFHAECSCQILFAEYGSDWQDSLKLSDSHHHLLARTKIQAVFSNSIKRDYKLLPRYKLNISVSSIHLNISDRIIGLLLDFADNLPKPEISTMPVPYSESRDFVYDFAEFKDIGLTEIVQFDKILPDPGYKELVKLRQRLVADYLRRNRSSVVDLDRVQAKLGFQEKDKTFISSEHSDEDMEVYARSVDLPGFDDNVSPSNHISTLMRFVIGEIVINLARSTDASERPYITLEISKVCLDIAVMTYGPGIQLCIEGAELRDHAQGLKLLTTQKGDLLNLLYRKVRASCPDFRTHFHSVEQSLVADTGDLVVVIHSDALRTLYKYMQYMYYKIQNRYSVNMTSSALSFFETSWHSLTRPDKDPPVPAGATKFSYSIRISSIQTKLCHIECSVLELKFSGLESEFVFRANDRMLFKMYLAALHVDEANSTTMGTLYPALVWPDEDKVLEMKYVRSPRLYGQQAGNMKANGEFRLYLGRLHVVMFYGVVHHVQQFLEPLVPNTMAVAAMQSIELAARTQLDALATWSARLNLVIEIHAPILLLPQKPSSPNLLVLNMGDLMIENFFKQLNTNQQPTSPNLNPIIDNILVKLTNVTLSRAVMTLAGTLEVQEPILEPLSTCCDIKRCVSYQQVAHGPNKQVLLLEADVCMEPIRMNLGQRDMATMASVWSDNFGEVSYMGATVPSSPVDVASSDVSVKKLQEFFAQGEPVKKDAVLRFTLDGLELMLFTDMDEVLSSPMRDLTHCLAQVTCGELIVSVDSFSDKSCELKLSLQSVLVEDVRPESTDALKKVFSCQTPAASSPGFAVRVAPLVEATARSSRGGRALDVRVDRTRLNLAPSFVMQLARAVLCAVPGDKSMEGGIINQAYEAEANTGRASNRFSCSDCTSGYHSAASGTSEEPPSLSIAIQFRQPEIMLFSDASKTEGHGILIRAEILMDYSVHSNTENFVVSLASLQIMSKFQSTLKALPPQIVLKPCDIEFSKSFKSMEEGIRVALKVSDIDMHVSPTTVHAVMDILDDIRSELHEMPDEKEPFNFATYKEKSDEDLWCPKKMNPYLTPLDDGIGARSPENHPPESLDITQLNLRVVFELFHEVPVPLFLIKMSGSLNLQDWSKRAHGSANVSLYAASYNCDVHSWEPVVEPAPKHDNVGSYWRVMINIFQAKAYSMSSKMDLNDVQNEQGLDASAASEKSSNRSKSRQGFESETSADEDTDNEMTFIKNPNAKARSYSVDTSGGVLAFGVDSDSDNDSGLMDKLTAAMGHLFTDESSGEDNSGDDDSSAAEYSDYEIIVGRGDFEKAVSFNDTDTKVGKKEIEHKSVTLKEPTREDSLDSVLETETFAEKLCTYIVLEAKDPLNFSVTPQAAKVICDLMSAFKDRQKALASCIMTGFEGEFNLINDIGPGTTVHLVSRSETDLAGNDRIVAIADYDADTSRPSTPGLDTSAGDVLEEEETKAKPSLSDLGNEWDWSAVRAGGSPGGGAPAAARQLYARVTDTRLVLRAHDFSDLTVLCPQRSCQKLHVLYPSKNGTRYYVVVETDARYSNKRIVVRSPLQVRNETSYALELYYKKTDLETLGLPLMGEVTNPFDDKMRVATIQPHDTYNVPLYIAYHCKLFLLPCNFESYQTTSQGIWWMDLANELGTPRNYVCPAKANDDPRIFAVKIVTVEGLRSQSISRAIPRCLFRVVPPIGFYNRLPYAFTLSTDTENPYKVRLEPGERAHAYTLDLRNPIRFKIELPHHRGLKWVSFFTFTEELTEKSLRLRGLDSEPACTMTVMITLNGWKLTFYAPYWLVNKTGLPLQIKCTRSDEVHEVDKEPLLLPRDRRAGGRGARYRVRVHQSCWSRGAALHCAPGLIMCAHAERRTHFRILRDVTLSDLSPQLTKIVTFLPYFLVYNETKQHIRFMEENEAADLWIDLAPQQCTPFWPQTSSMMLQCKFRDSNMVSQHFPIARTHFTVLRMDRGLAMTVEVTGGTVSPFVVLFKPYLPGDAPVRIDNICDDLFLKLHQIDSGQVALLSPYQSMLFTWDDPAKDRTLMWNIYNNKGKGFVADFSSDGYGEEKVSFRSVKQSSLFGTNSMTSKLSSTLKRLTPRSPEPCSSSSDDSDSSDLPEHHKTKKMRRDKVIVYWVSYLDDHQRVFVLTQDERLAYHFRMNIIAEKSNYEIYTSLHSISLSVCVNTSHGVKELSYTSITDSLPQWEVHVSNKWKQLAPDLNSWLEDKYKKDEKKCNLKEYIHIDLEKMQMTKPFFSELRRTYYPGVMVQYRKSNTHSFVYMRLNRIQIDNQLNEAVFPCVLYPNLPRTKTRNSTPSLQFVVLKQTRPNLNQEYYKYVKVLFQEHCINLDRGFVNHVFDILNHCGLEEKPAVRLRYDFTHVHTPVLAIAQRFVHAPQRNVVYEYVHFGPIKFVISLSSMGHLTENNGSPVQAKFGRKYRPKLFDSDLLEYLFNSWGSSLCDVKDVVFRTSFLEIKNTPMIKLALLQRTILHYWMQIVQQFYVMVLGLNILGNPYASVGDFSCNMTNFYEPHMGTLSARYQEVSRRLFASVAGILGHCVGDTSVTSLLPELDAAGKVAEAPLLKLNDLPEIFLDAIQSSPTSIALALSGLIARPTFDVYRSAAKGVLPRGCTSGLDGLKTILERRLVARRRLPRHCSSEGLQVYSNHAALGVQLLSTVGTTDQYMAHVIHRPDNAILLTNSHIYLVRASSTNSWHVESVMKLDDLLGVPTVEGDKLILNIRQDESVNYYSTDERVIEVANPEVLSWIQEKIECALILAMEDKRCPEQL